MVWRCPGGIRRKKLIWLATFMGRYPAELRADFRQYYHISADNIGRTVSITEAADLAAMLPLRSRCMSAVDQRLSWDVEHHLLARIADTLSYFFWSTTVDGMNGRNQPECVMRPGEMRKTEAKGEGKTVEECREILHRKRVTENGN